MKKSFRWMITLFVVLFAVGIVLGIGAYQPESKSDTTSFLQFEKQVELANAAHEAQYGKIDLTDEFVENAGEFALKKLIVTGKLSNTYGAVDTVSYNDTHFLYYATEDDAEKAYDKLCGESGITVSVSRIEKAEAYVEENYDYSSYKNWGAKAMDVQGYRAYLASLSESQKEVVVAVLDTGINTTHPMFENRLLTDENGKIVGYSYKASNKNNNDANLAIGDNGYSFEDDVGHGTHVAGIICSLTPENVKILPIRIGNSYSDSGTMLEAYQRVLKVYSEKYNIVCTNLSFSGGGKTDEQDRDNFNDVVGKLMEKGILSVTAAGNESSENNLDGLKSIVVSAAKKIDGNGYFIDKSYTNFGNIVDIAAPGTDIYSAYIETTETKGGEKVGDVYYKTNSGTSMASPQVAGALALLYLDPNNDKKTAEAMEAELYSNAVDMGDVGKDVYYGNGMLNLKYAEITERTSLSVKKDGIDVTAAAGGWYDGGTVEITLDVPEGYEIYYTGIEDYSTGLVPGVKGKKLDGTTFTSAENKSLFNYFIGLKLDSDGNVVGRTNLCFVYYFNEQSPYDDSFFGTQGEDTKYTYLNSYIGQYKKVTLGNDTTVNGLEVIYLPIDLFNGTNVEEVYLNYTGNTSVATTIPGRMFTNCKNLKTVYAPDVEKIYLAAFMGSSIRYIVDTEEEFNRLGEGVYLPNLVETIQKSFTNCTNLESVSLCKYQGAAKERMEDGYEFFGCTNLKTVNLPALKNISSHMFANCTSLSEKFTIGKDVTALPKYNPFAKSAVTGFIVDENNVNIYTDGYGLYSKDGMHSFATGAGISEYAILSEVKINGVDYPVERINDQAFIGVNIDKLTIPASITFVGEHVASDSAIGTLYYNATNVVADGKSGYWVNGGIAKPFEKIGSIVIGEGVESVPQRLFQNVAFDELHILSKNTSFGGSCFYWTDSKNKAVFDLYLDYDDVTDDLTWTDNSQLSANRQCRTLYARMPVDVSVLHANKAFMTYWSFYEREETPYYVYIEKSRVTVIPTGVWALEVKIGEDVVYRYVGEDDKSRYNYFGANNNATTRLRIKPIGEQYDVQKIVVGSETFDKTAFSKDEEGYYLFDMTVADEQGIDLRIDVVVKTFTITPTAGAGGNVTSNRGNVFTYGTDASYYITTERGYHISKIIVDGVEVEEKSSPYTFTNITEDHTIHVEFEINTYTVKVASCDNVTVTPSEQTVQHGESAHFKITLAEGYRLSSLSYGSARLSAEELEKVVVDGLTIENVQNNITVTLNTAIKAFTLNSSAGVGGSISMVGTIRMAYGSKVTYRATPQTGYHLVKYIVNGVDYEPSETLVIQSVKEDYEIYAEFAPNTYTVTSSVNGAGGSISTVGEQTVSHGNSLTYTFTPDAGYKVSSIIIDGTALTGDEFTDAVKNGYTFRNVADSHTIEVAFSEYDVKIAASSGQGGSISFGGNVVIKAGSNVTFEFTPLSGYRISQILVDGVAVAISGSYTFENVTEDHTIHVEFVKNSYTIKASVKTGAVTGTISPEGVTTVNNNESVTYTITANVGYRITMIVIDNEVQTFGDNVYNHSVTLYNVTEDHEITAYFDYRICNIYQVPAEGGFIDGPFAATYGIGRPDYVFAPYKGYRVKDFRIELPDGTEMSPKPELQDAEGGENYKKITLSNLTEDSYTIYVEFEKIPEVIATYKVSVVTDGNGKVVANASLDAVENGGSRTFIITPNKGYALYRVTVNGKLISVENNMFTLENITADTSVIVSFKEDAQQVVPVTPAPADNADKEYNDIYVYVALALGILSFILTVALIVACVKYKQIRNAELYIVKKDETDDE